MFEGAFTLSDFYRIAGFLLSMYACVSNDIIQTLGTFLSANKKPRSIIYGLIRQ